MSYGPSAQELMSFAKEHGVYETLEKYIPNWQQLWSREWVDSLIAKEEPEWVVIRIKAAMESFTFSDPKEFEQYYDRNVKLDEYKQYLKHHPNFYSVLQITDKISEINVAIAKLNSDRIYHLDQLKQMLETKP
jgi:hypothetical protein